MKTHEIESPPGAPVFHYDFADVVDAMSAKLYLLEHVQVCAAHHSVLAFVTYLDIGGRQQRQSVPVYCACCADMNYQAGRRAYGDRMFMMKNRFAAPKRLALVWDAEWDMRGLTR